MTDRRPTKATNLDRYGNPPLEWSRVHDPLKGGWLNRDMGQFLATSSSDGVPHSAGVGGAWLDGDLYFTSSPRARKARNIAENPRATISMRLEGIDAVFEGDVSRVTDKPTLEKLKSIYNEGGWPATVEGDAFTAPFSAPSAGPPPWNVYRLRCHTVYGVATEEPNGATKWTFDA
jgi:hypothetical protein